MKNEINVMKSTELRIGNIITSKSSTIPFEVTEDDFCYIIDNPEHYLPVALTDEWLVKFGAIYKFERFVYSRFQIIKHLNRWHITDLNSNCYFTAINFVHEWQNFVFIMDEEELTIKTN